MKASPFEALPEASVASLGSFLTQGTNPALAARSFLQTGREALAESFAPGKAITPFLRQTSDMVDTVFGMVSHKVAHVYRQLYSPVMTQTVMFVLLAVAVECGNAHEELLLAADAGPRRRICGLDSQSSPCPVWRDWGPCPCPCVNRLLLAWGRVRELPPPPATASTNGGAGGRGAGGPPTAADAGSAMAPQASHTGSGAHCWMVWSNVQPAPKMSHRMH